MTHAGSLIFVVLTQVMRCMLGISYVPSLVFMCANGMCDVDMPFGSCLIFYVMVLSIVAFVH